MKSTREKIKDVTREEIKQAARQMMAEKGTAGLSIRAIARTIGMTPPALYHYYANLNELITALIYDAFVDLADTLEQAAALDAHPAERLIAVAKANRAWALAHPTDFQLIYGNPIPGYTQPTEITYPPARRSFRTTAQIFADALEGGLISLPAEYQTFPPEIEQSLKSLTEIEGHDYPPAALYLAASAWSKIHGHIMLELFHLIQPVIGSVDTFFEYELALFLKQIGFQQSKE